MTPPDITTAELARQVRDWAQRLLQGDPLAPDDYLAIGRLWNTIAAHPSLHGDPDCQRFLDLVRAEVPAMATALNMTAGRGFALTSTDPDFVLGGVLDERYRYRVTDLGDLEPPSS